MLMINASRVDSHLLIRKRFIGTWFISINASRVDFNLLLENDLLGPGYYYQCI